MYQIIGKERVDYVSKTTGNRVVGHRIYLLEENKRVEGFKASNVYVDEDTFNKYFSNVPLDSFVDLYFNVYKQVVACSVVK